MNVPQSCKFFLWGKKEASKPFFVDKIEGQLSIELLFVCWVATNRNVKCIILRLQEIIIEGKRASSQ